MKEFVISEAKVEIAVLVGLITQTQDERKTNEYLDAGKYTGKFTAGKYLGKSVPRRLVVRPVVMEMSDEPERYRRTYIAEVPGTLRKEL